MAIPSVRFQRKIQNQGAQCTFGGLKPSNAGSRARWLTPPTRVAGSVSRRVETPLAVVPLSDKPMDFCAYVLSAFSVQPTRCLRRKGGEQSTCKGNKPAIGVRFLTSDFPFGSTP